MTELCLIENFLQTEPQVKSMISNIYELYYTVIKNRDEKEEDELDKRRIMVIMYITILLCLNMISELNLVKYYWGRENEISDKPFQVFHTIKLDTQNWIAANVIFVVLLFIEHPLLNTWEAKSIWKLKNKMKWLYQSGCFKSLSKIEF